MVAAEGDPITIVPPPVITLSITWCRGHNAYDCSSKRYIDQIKEPVIVCSFRLDQR